MNGLYIHLHSGKYLLSLLIYSNSLCLSFFLFLFKILSSFFIHTNIGQILSRHFSFFYYLFQFGSLVILSFSSIILLSFLFFFLTFYPSCHFLPSPPILSLQPFSPSSHFILPPPPICFSFIHSSHHSLLNSIF